MEEIVEKIKYFLVALKTLEKVLKAFYESRAIYNAHPTEKNQDSFFIVRDATIQRFEYCTDLIWKVIKTYLEDVEKINIESFSPRSVVREAVKSGFISELEGKDLMNMVESRNKTSHIYHEAVADDIANKIPQYYIFIKTIVDRMQKRITVI